MYNASSFAKQRYWCYEVVVLHCNYKDKLINYITFILILLYALINKIMQWDDICNNSVYSTLVLCAKNDALVRFNFRSKKQVYFQIQLQKFYQSLPL